MTSFYMTHNTGLKWVQMGKMGTFLNMINNYLNVRTFTKYATVMKIYPLYILYKYTKEAGSAY